MGIYMIHNDHEPATTVWETWNCDKGLASRNRHMYSSVSGKYQSEMAGLIIPKNTFNFEEVAIHFYPAQALGSYIFHMQTYPFNILSKFISVPRWQRINRKYDRIFQNMVACIFLVEMWMEEQ